MKKVVKDKKINYSRICLFLAIIGFVLTLIYIFKTSTSILTSDSVITDVLAHEQKMNKQLLLKDWYYGNEFWLFSLSIPTLLLSFFMHNQLLIRQISVLITAIIFFILLYKYSKDLLEKKDRMSLIAIFASGISYSVLDYFYAFNAYLTVVINSMFLLFLLYKCIEEKDNKKIYFSLSLLFTFLFNIGSMRYFPLIVIPFFITELIFIIRDNINLKPLEILKKDVRIKKCIAIIIVVIMAFGTYKFLTTHLHFEDRASDMKYASISSSSIEEGLQALGDCVINFFGFDNKNHSNTFMMAENYFLKQKKHFSLLSVRGISYFIKFLVCILFMVLLPIKLFKTFKEHDKKIQFLIIFNTISWFFMIFSYLFLTKFFYNSSELKYFLFNIILNIILGIYCLSKYYCKKNIVEFVTHTLLIFYIISNLYTTSVTVIEHNKKTLDRRYELVNLLKKNNLTFGYSSFWDGLMTYYLSDYEIVTVGVTLSDRVRGNYWYSDVRWYKEGYHKGKTFLVLDYTGQLYKEFYIQNYGNPNDIISSKNYVVFVYDKNPFDGTFNDQSKDGGKI